MMQITNTVKQLIIINIIFFLGAWYLGNDALHYLALYFPENDFFQYWQPLTHMFMHSGIPHIIFNMLGLWMFGSALEHFWGPGKFLFFYISCGLGAAFLHMGMQYYFFSNTMDILTLNGVDYNSVINALKEGTYDQQWLNYITHDQWASLEAAYARPMVGASGALYGLMVAFAFMFPNVKMALIFVPIPLQAKYFVLLLICLDMFFALRGQSLLGSRWDDGIAHFAHLGGAILGFIMMWFWRDTKYNHKRWD